MKDQKNNAQTTSNNNRPFSWQAEDYHQNSHLQEDAAKDLLAASSIKSSDKVLDVGCGDGKVTAFIAQHKVPDGAVTGVDFSNNMIDFAQRAYPPTMYTNLRFAVGDAANLTFSRSFDFVVSFFALHWVKNQKEALAGMHEALLPGGRLLLCMGTDAAPHNRPNYLREAIIAVAARKKWDSYFAQTQRPWNYPQKVATYGPLLEQCHFSSIDVGYHQVQCIYQHKESLINSIRAWLPYVKSLPSPLMQQTFLEEIVDYYLAQSNARVNDDGSITTYVYFLLAQAEKEA